MAQLHPKDSQRYCPLSLGDPGRPAARKTSAKPRTDRLRPAVAEDDLMAALRCPKNASKQLGAPRGAPFAAWSDHIERPGPRYPVWTVGEEAKDEDSSVSSGRLSGSSGGHQSCTPAHRPWKERPPLVLGSPRRHRESNLQLEQLREKIRAQTWGQASCASLGTSVPSSASHLHRASPPAPRRKVRKLRKPPPAPVHPGFGTLSAPEHAVPDKAIPAQDREPSRASRRQASVSRETPRRMRSRSCKREKAPQLSTRRVVKEKDSELAGVYAWRKGQALVRGLLGAHPALPTLQSQAPSGALAPTTELGDMEKGAVESSPLRPQIPSPTSVHSGSQVPASTPHLAFRDPAGTIQSALAILRDLRQQIQAGLELAQDHHPGGGREPQPSTLWPQELAGRRHQGCWSAPDVRASLTNGPLGPTKGMHPSLERARNFPTGQRWSSLAWWECCPQRTWSSHGRDPTLQRPGSPPERPSHFPQRPWSALAGAPYRDWKTPARVPWNPPERPSPPAQRPWSASCVKRTSTLFKGPGSLLPLSGAKNTWPRASGKETEARLPPPCPKPRGFLGHPYSAESLREFMRKKALARRQQALQEKASAVQALELRSQRLRDVYRQQRAAVLGRAVPGRAGPTRAFPMVSQTTPSIVTFVPHSAQSRGQEAPGSRGSPGLQWSKVTSGMVLGDQEAPGSFCLCLDKALNCAETPETGDTRDSWEGAPLLMPASSSSGPLRLQDLTAHRPCPGLCIYLNPEEAERLGTRGPLHFQYKQARLQALETMGNVLSQRIDMLTTKLLRSEAADTLEDLASDLPPSPPSAESVAPTAEAPACPGALVPNGGRGSPWAWTDVPARLLLSPACLPDSKRLLWSPGWEQQHSMSPSVLLASSPPGFPEGGRSKSDQRLARDTASVQALGPLAESSLRVPAPLDPTLSSQWLKEMPSAGGASQATPWTVRSCGQREPGRPPFGHFEDLQQKSLSFLRSLKLDQQEQEQALALLRRRAELEAWETQKSLEELVLKHRLERLVQKQGTPARPGAASELERMQLSVDPDPKTPGSPVTARPRSQPPLGRDAAPSWGPEEGWESQAGMSASVEPTSEGEPDHAPSQLPLARIYPWDDPIHQVQTESRYLGDSHLLVRRHERALLLQHHRNVLSVQRSLSRLRQELRATTRLLQSSSPEATATWERDSETSQQPEGLAQGSSGPLTPRRPGSPPSHHPWRGPESPGVPLPITTQQDGTTPKTTSAWDIHRWPLRPAWGTETPTADGQPSVQGGLVESSSHQGQGDPPPHPSPSSTEESRALRESQARSFQGGSLHSRGRAGPYCPGEASVTEGHTSHVKAERWLDCASSPVREAPDMERQWSEEQRTENCWQEDPHDPHDSCSWQEATQLNPCPAPAAAEEEAPPAQLQSSPRPQLTAPLALDSTPESISGTCSGWSEGSHTPSSVRGLSCPSLQEFQKVSAFLVQLSGSSTSLSDCEGGNTPDAGLGLSGESSAESSRGLHGDGGQVTCGASPLQGSSTVSGGPESGPGLLQAGWPLPCPDVSSPRSRSELSEASSEIWKEGSLLGPGMGAQPATERPLPAGGSSNLEDGGPGGGQEASGTSGSLVSKLDTGKATRTSHGAACTTFPPSTSSCSASGLFLPFLSGPSAPKVGDLSKGRETGPLQASAGCPEGPWEADLSPPTNQKLPQAAPGAPRVLAALRSKSWALGPGGSGAPFVPQEAHPALASSILPEILSPVDEELSYGSADLPSSSLRDAFPPPLPPTLPADSGATLSHPSEDFPSPPEDAMSPGGSLGSPGEDASINSWELTSLSEEEPPEALSLGPSLCPGAGGQGRTPGDQLGELYSVGGNQAMGGQRSEPVGWPDSPSGRGSGGHPGKSVQPPAGAPVPGEDLPALLTTGHTGFPGAWQGAPAPALDVGPSADPPGMDRAEVVDLVSTQLTRRILCDSLAVLSELAPPGSLPMGELLGVGRVPGPPTATTGQSWGRQAF